ncbi:hypothetical protein cypCar_00030252 [Cyprinus carpio]|nr:hypothetical protein cypCar_00030252 [Cyprinus carpio]
MEVKLYHFNRKENLLLKLSERSSLMAGKEMKNRGGKCLKEVHTATEALKTLYWQKWLPLEKYYGFSDFQSSSLEDKDFDNKPMILVVGQCSTGKTTFIRRVLQ